MIEFVIGALTGILSGMGVGGGTLLVLWMTSFGGIDQYTAGGINLFYFLGCAPASLPGHIKRHEIVWKPVIFSAVAGTVTAIGFSFLGAVIETALLRRLFGGLLVIVGLRELFGKKESGQ